jgi:hypothetical protein
MKAALLSDLSDAVAPLQRQSQESFIRKFLETVEKHDWHGWTSEGSAKGIAWRTRVICETNIRTSYAAGRYAQLTDPELLALRPYWKYVHSDLSVRPRPMHKLWGDMNLTLRHDDPFWRTHFPRNGWGCRCRVVAMRGPEAGAPAGIDKGWAYAGGNARGGTPRPGRGTGEEALAGNRRGFRQQREEERPGCGAGTGSARIQAAGKRPGRRGVGSAQRSYQGSR